MTRLLKVETLFSWGLLYYLQVKSPFTSISCSFSSGYLIDVIRFKFCLISVLFCFIVNTIKHETKILALSSSCPWRLCSAGRGEPRRSYKGEDASGWPSLNPRTSASVLGNCWCFKKDYTRRRLSRPMEGSCSERPKSVSCQYGRIDMLRPRKAFYYT